MYGTIFLLVKVGIIIEHIPPLSPTLKRWTFLYFCLKKKVGETQVHNNLIIHSSKVIIPPPIP